MRLKLKGVYTQFSPHQDSLVLSSSQNTTSFRSLLRVQIYSLNLNNNNNKKNNREREREREQANETSSPEEGIFIIIHSLLLFSVSFLLMQSIMPWGRSSSVTYTVTSSLLLAVALYLAPLLISNSWMDLLFSESQTDHPLGSPHRGCLPRHFKIGTMPNCAAWLQCLQIKTEIHKLTLIGQGVVKKVKV